MPNLQGSKTNLPIHTAIFARVLIEFNKFTQSNFTTCLLNQLLNINIVNYLHNNIRAAIFFNNYTI